MTRKDDKTALDKKGIASKFKGRGAIRNAFVYAMNDLEKAIKSLSDKQRTKIFNNGYNFMNLEVMYPASANVIDYDVTQLIFHGALKYNDKGGPSILKTATWLCFLPPAFYPYFTLRTQGG